MHQDCQGTQGFSWEGLGVLGVAVDFALRQHLLQFSNLCLGEVGDGKAPVSAEEVGELLELDILEPTEPDVWEMYHRGLIDKEKRDSLLSPFKHKRQQKKRERIRKQKQVQKWQGMRHNQIDMELARNAEPDEWVQYMILKRLGVV